MLSLFSLMNFAVSDEIKNAIFYFVGHLKYVTGILDIDTLFKAIGTYFVFSSLFYSYNILRWAFAHMPFIGKSVPLPDDEHPVDLRKTPKGVLDLRKGRYTQGNKRFWDIRKK